MIIILVPALMAAQTSLFGYIALLDTDNDPTTGCAVTVGGDQFLGAEHVVTIQVDSTSASAIAVHKQLFQGGVVSPRMIVDHSGGRSRSTPVWRAQTRSKHRSPSRSAACDGDMEDPTAWRLQDDSGNVLMSGSLQLGVQASQEFGFSFADFACLDMFRMYIDQRPKHPPNNPRAEVNACTPCP